MMRLFSIALVAGALTAGSVATATTMLASLRDSESQPSEAIARQDDTSNTVHRGSGRRQILAFSFSLAR